MNMLLNLLRQLFNYFRRNKYPYQYLNNELDVKFKINNSIEEFRLVNWGGEKEYVISLIKELKDDDVFYDIGASVGLISVLAGKKLTRGSVISFEPDPENQFRLKENYKINNLSNFLLQTIAVGEKNDLLKLYTSGSNGYSPSLRKVNGIEAFIEVEVNSIDNLIDNKLIPLPTVIKIDIEGAEFLALKGMFNLLTSVNAPKLIFVELHPEFLSAFSTDIEEIFSYMNQFNYDLIEKEQRDKQILCKFLHKI
jgi:FkbM family methyltransferase